MSANRVIARFYKLGGHLWLDGKQLRYEVPKEVPSSEYLLDLKKYKNEIINILEQAQRMDDSIIPKVERIPENLKLSYAQERLWFLAQLEGSSGAYNLPGFLSLKGELNHQALERSLQHIVKRHEILRTNFSKVEGQAIQMIHSSISVPLDVIDLTELSPERQRQKAQAIFQTESIYPFDLKSDPLLKATLMVLNEKEHLLLFNMHHIISDGWSMEILSQELNAFYKAALTGELVNLPELPIQYADFASWQRKWLEGGKLDKQLSYWKRQLAEAPPLLELPTDFPRPPIQTFNGSRLSFVLSPEITNQLKELAKETQATLFMNLLAGFSILLSRYSNMEEIVIGSSIANRRRSELEHLIGFFVNTLAIRVNLTHNLSFKELLQKVKSVALDAYSNQDVPFEQVVEALQPERNLRYSPLFQVMFDLQSTPLKSLELPGLLMERVEQEFSIAKFDLTLTMRETENGLHGEFEYNTDLFRKATIERMVTHLITLFEGIVSSPEQNIFALPLLTETERRQILVEWNETQVEYPKDKWNATRCIHQLFEEQVEKAPEAIAVIFENQETETQQLTYQELNQRANQLAHYLVEQGVKPDTLIGLCVERSLEMMIGILGILKAGGAYVPIDPSYPQTRIETILEDSGIEIVLTETHLLSELPLDEQQILPLDNGILENLLAGYSVENIDKKELGLSSDHLAYVIYTSGSTGLPKGVLITHRSVSNYLNYAWHTYLYDFIAGSIVSTSIAFDATLTTLYTPLCAGKYVILLPENDRLLEWLAKYLKDDEKSFLFKITPAHLEILSDQKFAIINKQAKHVIVIGGEQLTKKTIYPWKKNWLPDSIFINEYGPTETVVGCSTYQVSEMSDEQKNRQGSIPIGRPIGNTKLYVFNDELELQAIGIPGELYIGGDGLARGYLNQPELTQEQFVPNPFEEGTRVYKTGDLVRWLPDGNMEFLGRLDHQIQLRGFRIELGEIEATLNKMEPIQASFIVLKEDEANGKNLVAYIIANEKNLSPQTIRKGLEESLPEYMIPSAYVLVDQFPLTLNGKIDRNALPAPDGSSWVKKEYIAPSTQIEKSLVEIWQNLLQIEKIGMEDNFFELGGHSLLAIQLLSKIQEQLNYEIALTDLFHNQTVVQLSNLIEQHTETENAFPHLISNPEERFLSFPLTDVQHAYWIGSSGLYELGEIGTHLYTEILWRGLDHIKLERCLNFLIQRHEMLRMVVTKDGRQQILEKIDPYKIQIEHTDREYDHFSNAVKDKYFLSVRNELSHQIFSSETWPLFDLRCTRINSEEVILHVSIDALLADGGSMTILSNELIQLYDSPKGSWSTLLPPISISFRDYILTEQKIKESLYYSRSKKYWLDRIEDFPLAPELPLKIDPSQIEDIKFERRIGSLSPANWSQLQSRIKALGVTSTSLILTCFGMILKQWSMNPRFTINLTLFNRLPFHEEVDRLVGDFTSLTMLGMDFSGFSSLKVQLKQIQEDLWSDLEHKYFSGVEVQRELSTLHGRTIIMPVVLTSLLGMEAQETTEGTNENIKTVYSISQTSQVWIDHQVFESEGELIFNWDSVSGLFPEGMLDDMFTAYQKLLNALIEDEALWEQGTIDFLPTRQYSLREASNSQRKIFNIPGLAGKSLMHYLVFEKAMTQKQAVALRWGEDEKMSYGELLNHSIQLGKTLSDSEARPNALVALIMEKGWQQIVGALGIQSSGAAYLPIEASLPQNRIQQLLEIGEVEWVVTTPKVKNALEKEGFIFPELIREVISIEKLETEEFKGVLPNPIQKGEDIAYVIFTSGSTGTPKGVVIDHQGALNTIFDINERFGVSEKDSVLALSALNFDLSVYDVFGVLGAGGCVVLPAPTEDREPHAWLGYLNQYHVTIWNTVPAYMQMLIEIFPDYTVNQDLRLVLMSGDWIPMDLPEKIKGCFPNSEVISLGGATEASIWSIFYPIDQVYYERWGTRFSSIPYGKPLSNQSFHILNDGKPAPEWVPGNLYIGGIGLAQGYWKDDEKTNLSFITHSQTGERLYKTGDLGRYLPDGNIEFLGRDDFQVKIQGHRIELGEIESKLSLHPQIKEAVVTLYELEKNNKALVAYVVPENQINDESVGVIEDKQVVLEDPLDRKVFKIAQKNIRKFEENSDTVSLALLEEDQFLSFSVDHIIASDVSFDGTPLSHNEFSRLLSCLSARQIKDYPLPKYFYPSAGSLYPVQCYLSVKQNKVDGVPGGNYYYNPVVNKLFLISHESEQEGAEDTVFQLFLIAEMEAILPMYGHLSHDFCLLEAGYMATLLESGGEGNHRVRLCSTTIDHVSDKERFNLKEGQEILAVFEGGYCSMKPKTTLSQKTRLKKRKQEGIDLLLFEELLTATISQITRKTYRVFLEESIPFSSLSKILYGIRQIYLLNKQATERFDIFISTQNKGIDQLGNDCFKYDPNLHQLFPLNSDSSIIPQVFSGNELIAETSVFSIFFSIDLKENMEVLDQELLLAGKWGQIISHYALVEKIGICAIGALSEKKAQGMLKISSSKKIVHSFLGGKVTSKQIEEFEVVPNQSSEEMLKKFLSQHLPLYMIPQKWISLTELPLTKNGKLDRNALPKPDIFVQEYIAPRNQIERVLVDIWQDVLQIEKIGIHDNFFELGGQSLLATRLVSKIHKYFSDDMINIAHIFEHQTIAALGLILELPEEQPSKQKMLITEK